MNQFDYSDYEDSLPNTPDACLYEIYKKAESINIFLEPFRRVGLKVEELDWAAANILQLVDHAQKLMIARSTKELQDCRENMGRVIDSLLKEPKEPVDLPSSKEY
jgi:hypothetical protein